MADDPETERAMGRLLKKIGMNPKTRPMVVQAIRTVDPNARFPDIEAKETRDYVDQRFEEEDTKREQTRQTNALARERRQVAEQFGDENLPAIEKYMIDNGVPNYQVAAKAWGADNRPAMPNNMPRPAEPWQQPPNMKDLLANRKDISFKNAYAAIDDIHKMRQSQRHS